MIPRILSLIFSVSFQGVDYKISTIGDMLRSGVGSENGFTLYIVDNLGRLIASNIEGAALDAVTRRWGVLAIEAPQISISATASGLLKLKGSWDAVNGIDGIVIFVPGVGLSWVKSTKVTDRYGLHWHVVVVEVIKCNVGSFLNEDLHGGVPCLDCPENTECDGLSNLHSLQLAPGFWRISSSSTVVLECPIEESCVGGSNPFEYCARGYEGE